MVNYATKSGIIRDFSDIAIMSIKNGQAKLIQHLTSIKNGVSYHEAREATTTVLPGEDRESLAIRLNGNSDIIINSSGNLASLTMAV